MKNVVEKALTHWGFSQTKYSFVAARENTIYRIETEDECFALRIHRQGYRSDTELLSELEWMAEVSGKGISTPKPVASLANSYLVHIDGHQIDLLTWLSGVPMDRSIDQLGTKERAQIFHDLGQEMAKLHLACDAWKLPAHFDRVHWNIDGLLGETPLWDRFWENPELSKEDRDLFIEFRHSAHEQLTNQENPLDYGLIHADLVPANVLIDNRSLHLIDFDDGGFGYRLFDVATALMKHEQSSDYPNLQEKIIAGYRSVRTLDTDLLDLFIAIRSVTYVGWNIERITEHDGAERNKRFIDSSRRLVTRYLSR